MAKIRVSKLLKEACAYKKAAQIRVSIIRDGIT